MVPSELPETVIPDDPALDADRPHRPAPQRLTHPDWLFHRFSVSGSRVELAAFRAAAAGAAFDKVTGLRRVGRDDPAQRCAS